MSRKPCLKTHHPTIAPPAYPFRGPELFCDLRGRLSRGRPGLISYHGLGQMIGRGKSTAHHWFAIFRQPHVLSFVCLLERLDPEERQVFIDQHCRTFPCFKHLQRAGKTVLARKLQAVLNKKIGLTCIVGAVEHGFVAAVLGHEASVGSVQAPVGFSLCRPDKFVPVESLTYIEPAVGTMELRNLIEDFWPRMVTSSASMLILDGVWPGVRPRRRELFRIAMSKHVIISEEVLPDELRRFPVEIDLVDLNLPGLQVIRRSKR